ncbi:hypothetical protein M514_15007 [Trichuris suis]|uniref:Uncharacterized protein n=1 Tax=Trichuris suis TaxID=68888 RepID=A0A085NT07_9BILA|nr:hypothetical protein M514_15007 [Trichuris suis]
MKQIALLRTLIDEICNKKLLETGTVLVEPTAINCKWVDSVGWQCWTKPVFLSASVSSFLLLFPELHDLMLILLLGIVDTMCCRDCTLVSIFTSGKTQIDSRIFCWWRRQVHVHLIKLNLRGTANTLSVSGLPSVCINRLVYQCYAACTKKAGHSLSDVLSEYVAELTLS